MHWARAKPKLILPWRTQILLNRLGSWAKYTFLHQIFLPLYRDWHLLLCTFVTEFIAFFKTVRISLIEMGWTFILFFGENCCFDSFNYTYHYAKNTGTTITTTSIVNTISSSNISESIVTDTPSVLTDVRNKWTPTTINNLPKVNKIWSVSMGRL